MDFSKFLNRLDAQAKAGESAAADTDPPAVKDAKKALRGLSGPVLSEDGKLRIFAYGSLAWNPSSEIDRAIPAHLDGHVRDYCCADTHYRGSVDNEGVTLGLRTDAEGTTPGMVLEIDIHSDQQAAEAIAAFAKREDPPDMPIYRFDMMDVTLPDGRTVKALACVADENGPLYRGNLSVEDRAQMIATAHGKNGTNLEYLVKSVTTFQEVGHPAHDLDKLLDATLQARLALPTEQQEMLAEMEPPIVAEHLERARQMTADATPTLTNPSKPKPDGNRP